MDDVLSIECPFCGVPPGARCMKGKRENSDVRRSHRARFDALPDQQAVMCKNRCGNECPPAKLHGRRLFCSDECRRAYWSTPPYDRPRA